MNLNTLQFVQLQPSLSHMQRLQEIQQGWQGAWSVQQLDEHFAHNKLNFAWLDEQNHALAFVLFQQVVSEANLLLVMVDANHQRKGLARRLLQQAFDVLRKAQVEKVYLELRESNHAALQLYQNLGFSLDGVRKHYYPAISAPSVSVDRKQVSQREHALLMSLVL